MQFASAPFDLERTDVDRADEHARHGDFRRPVFEGDRDVRRIGDDECGFAYAGDRTADERPVRLPPAAAHERIPFALFMILLELDEAHAQTLLPLRALERHVEDGE